MFKVKVQQISKLWTKGRNCFNVYIFSGSEFNQHVIINGQREVALLPNTDNVID